VHRQNSPTPRACYEERAQRAPSSRRRRSIAAPRSAGFPSGRRSPLGFVADGRTRGLARTGRTAGRRSATTRAAGRRPAAGTSPPKLQPAISRSAISRWRSLRGLRRAHGPRRAAPPFPTRHLGRAPATWAPGALRRARPRVCRGPRPRRGGGDGDEARRPPPALARGVEEGLQASKCRRLPALEKQRHDGDEDTGTIAESVGLRLRFEHGLIESGDRRARRLLADHRPRRRPGRGRCARRHPSAPESETRNA
jgi:hypothetical protein